MVNDITESLKGKSILILGFGREGKSTLNFVRNNMPDAVVAIADKNVSAFDQLNGDGLTLISGDNYLDCINDYDVVIKTPGISLLDVAIKESVTITSQTDLFMSAFGNQTIGITGTKGKSTTTSLVYHLLKSAGYDAVIAGNIGIPCFDIIDDIGTGTIVVYELSAHQLEYVHKSPHIGVLLNIFEEHLDHFGTFERYRQAKLNIMRYMGGNDYAVVHDMLLDEALDMFVNNIVFSQVDIADIVDVSALPLLGEHNLLNVRAALMACSAYGIDIRELVPYLYTFKPLEHRLESVGVFRGVTFVNDSISTIPQATISACKALARVDFLLLGGFDRGIDYSPLVEFLRVSRVPNLLFTGMAGRRMMQLMSAYDLDSILFYYNDMEEAFSYVKDKACGGDVCLLSPAASSYDQYKNFEERGAKFKRLAAEF